MQVDLIHCAPRYATVLPFSEGASCSAGGAATSALGSRRWTITEHYKRPLHQHRRVATMLAISAHTVSPVAIAASAAPRASSQRPGPRMTPAFAFPPQATLCRLGLVDDSSL